MKSTQDHIATHQLGTEMALDSHGRVLRRPHFFTAAEAQAEVERTNRIWSDLLMAERRKVQEAERKYMTLLETKVTGVTIVYPQILVRRRLHGLVHRLIGVK